MLSSLSTDWAPALLCPPPPLQLIWPWYCQGTSLVANFIRSLITGWLPALLLNCWLVLVLPRLVYLLVQVPRGLWQGGRGEARRDVARDQANGCGKQGGRVSLLHVMRVAPRVRLRLANAPRPAPARRARPQSEGSSFSLSALERRIGVVFFYWDVFNVFLQVGAAGGTPSCRAATRRRRGQHLASRMPTRQGGEPALRPAEIGRAHV